MQRSHSLLVQLACILLVAVAPIFGFFLYLLLRPSETNAQKEMRHTMKELLAALQSPDEGKEQRVQKLQEIKKKAEEMAERKKNKRNKKREKNEMKEKAKDEQKQTAEVSP